MKVLMACGNHWDSPIQVGDHHIAREFARRGWSVGFISAPLSPFHLLKNTDDLQRRWDIYSSGGRSDGKVWWYVPGSVFAPYPLWPFSTESVAQNWIRATVPPLTAVLARSGFETVDLLYLRDPRYLALIKSVPHSRSIYRIADRDSGFKSSSASLRAAERQLAQSVDLVVYTARTLRTYVERLSPRRSLHLPNGIEYDRFQRSTDLPPEYRAIPAPRVIYVGSMDQWFDFDLVTHLVRGLPDVSFVLIGPDKLARERLVEAPNLHILGPRSRDVIAGYMQHAQVGIIPFDTKGHAELVNAINPIKLYEYLACGLKVVSVRWEELEYLAAPIALCDSATEFQEEIYKAISPSKSDDGIIFAKKNDFSIRFSQLLESLELPT